MAAANLAADAPAALAVVRPSVGWTLAVAALAVVLLFPVVWLAAMAFKPDATMFARPTQWLFTPTLDHFANVAGIGFAHFMGASLALATVSTAMVVLIGTPAAYAFARFELRARDDLFLFILATRMAPPICLVIPFYLIFASAGLEIADEARKRRAEARAPYLRPART